MTLASRKDEKSMSDETINEQGAVFARTLDFRLRQISPRHNKILENVDRTDKLADGKREVSTRR